jgi:hypothetical protein
VLADLDRQVIFIGPIWGYFANIARPAAAHICRIA